MSATKLLFEIARGQWFLDVNNLSSYGLWLNSYLNGNKVFEKEKVEAVNRVISREKIDTSGKTVKQKFAYMSMHGVLTRFGDECMYGTEDYIEMLDQIEQNSDLEGTVIHFNGPGGSTDSMIPTLDFAKRKTKTIVGLIGAAGSATYWNALALSDYLIVEHEVLSSVGSVGVMWAYADAKPALEKRGIVFHEVYAPESEHKNQVFNLALEGKYDQIKTEMLSPLAKAFQADVRKNRPDLKEETGVLTGKMFQGSEAVRLNMVDAVGNLEDALTMLNVLNEIKNTNNS